MPNQTSSTPFETICIIGGGLIGSSMLRAIHKHALAKTTVLFDHSEIVRERAKDLKLAHIIAPNLASAVENAQIVILAVPVGQYENIRDELKSSLSANTILSDVGSTKASFLDVFSSLETQNIHLIPAHPVAGTENSGPDSGFAELFENRWCILTPKATADTNALELIKLFWQKLGSKIEIMEAKHHDLVLAVTSHLPHLIAYNIVGTAADLEEVTQSEVIKFSAGGFRDFTRLAASDPTMWRDIFLNNKDAILEILGRFNEDLSSLAKAIRWGDGDALFELFSRTRDIRRNIIEIGQETSVPDFGRHHPKS